jgi:hypothetical protein
MGNVIDMADFAISRLDFRSRIVFERGCDVWLKTDLHDGPSLDTNQGFDIAYGALEIADYLSGAKAADCVVMVEVYGPHLTLWLNEEMLQSLGVSFRAITASVVSDSRGVIYDTTQFRIAPQSMADKLLRTLQGAA